MEPWDYKIPDVTDDASAASADGGTSDSTAIAGQSNAAPATPTDITKLGELVTAVQQGIIRLSTAYSASQLTAVTDANVRDKVATIFNAFSGLMRAASGKWSIDGDGKMTAVDLELSGVLKTVTFQKDTVSAVGGQLLIANADKLAQDMTAMDTATMTISGETTFAANAILLVKDGTDTEYMRVVSAANAPLYTVTRDLAASYAANANPSWKAGAAIVQIGVSDGASAYSGGWLVADGNTPKYSVYKRTGLAYDAYTEYVTLGNLNGRLDYAAAEYGIAIGTFADGWFSYDPTNGLRTAGKLINQNKYTTGHAIDQGDLVARESGAVYRTRVNNWSQNNTATTLTINPYNAGTTNKPGRFVDVSDTVKLLLTATGNTTNDITASRIVCSPLSSSITSATANTAINTAANITADCDGCLFDTNKVFAVYTNAAGGPIYAKVLSGLDSGTTLNAEATVAAVCNNRCAVVPVTSTEVLVIYTDVNDNIVATSCTINAGTNAITVGATTTILSDADVLEVRWAERFESTTAYCITFYDSSAGITYVIAFTYTGGVLTPGTQASVVSALMRSSMASMGDNSMLLVGSTRSYGITRSGTALSVTANTAVGAGNFMYVCRMGKGNAVVTWRQAAGDIRYQAMDMDTVNGALTLLGSAGTETTTAGDDFLPMMVRLSPSRSIIFRDGTVANDEKINTIDWSNNYDQFLGVAAAAAISAASDLLVEGGDSDDITGGVDGTTAYADAGGGRTTLALGGTFRVGVYTGTANLNVKG